MRGDGFTGYGLIALALAGMVGACTQLLGNDFTILDGEGGSGAGTSAGGSGQGGSGGTVATLPQLACELEPSSVVTLRDLLGNGIQSPDFDEIHAVLADEDPRFFTSYPTPNGANGEVFTIGGDGMPTSWSLPANGFLDARAINPNFGAAIYETVVGADLQLNYLLVGANDNLGTGAQMGTLHTAPPGATYGRARLYWDPAGALEDLFVAYNLQSGAMNQTFVLPPASMGAGPQLVLDNDVNLAEGDYEPTALWRMGSTAHLWLGDIGGDPTRYLTFEGAGAPTITGLPADQHVERVELTEEGTFRVLGIILTDAGMGGVHLGNLPADELSGLDLTTLPQPFALDSFDEAATNGNFAWSDSHMIWTGRHEAMPRDLKLFVMHESGQLRFEGTFAVPSPPAEYQQIELVHAIANPFFSSLVGDIYVAWVERAIDPADSAQTYDRLRYGVINCTTVE